ncbi:MAG: outer membrane protein assembly factor BamD [Chromatiales bacterium]|nr:outer membrane protein assembly factor BamD [Chromatiales bacterium]
MRLSYIFLTVLVSLSTIVTGCAWFDDKSEEEEAETIYRTARSSLEKGNYAAALEKYEQLEKNYPFSPFANAALLETAYANYKSDQTEAAATMAAQFIKNNPNHRHLDYAYYLEGLSYFNYGKHFLDFIIPRDRTARDSKPLEDSFFAFKTLYQRFPNSEYREEARRRLVVLRNMLAVHEIRIGLFYYRQGSYVATINRMKYMLERYDGAQHTPDGLLLMARAYSSIGYNDLAEDTLRVLEYNYPAYAASNIKGLAQLAADERRGWMSGLTDLSDRILEQLRIKKRY